MDEIGGLAQRSRELFERGENLGGWLGAHCKFGEELQWDYDPDEVSDTRLIKNSSEFDVEVAKLDCDAVPLQAPDSGTDGPVLGGGSISISTTSSGITPDAIASSESTSSIKISIWRLNYLYWRTEAEADEENAGREALTGKVEALAGQVQETLTG